MVPFLALLVAACAAAPNVTFHRDIAPILQANCQECHRAGEIGKFPLMTYQEARPWAAAMKQATLSKKMPPWFADEHYGKFANHRALTPDEIGKIAAWADSGAAEGSLKDAPAPKKFTAGWNIPAPDTVLTVARPFPVPAKGKIDYQYLVVPTGFTEDKWIQMAEVRPSERSVVHHVVVLIRTPGAAGGGQDRAAEGAGAFGSVLTIYTPGMVPDILPAGQAKLVKAGSSLVFQMHYTANGTATEDSTKIGLVFAKEPPRERVITVAATNRGFRIPPGDAAHEVRSEFRLPVESKLVSLFPHMHLRGKDFEYHAVSAAGERQTLLKVPRYDFNWQLSYRTADQPLLAAGSRIECVAHFDNSPNNAHNPDASVEVRWGPQSWEEMMIGFLDVAVDLHKYPNYRGDLSKREVSAASVPETPRPQ
ncbi:MAG: cytochrome c [Candidatus Solibacter usitatus]|nr:cytochrome c [Candidatus Solibacter usitatus]